jgi:X-linked retinitis pigmentosa GTPase regulator
MNKADELPDLFPGARWHATHQASVDAILNPLGIKRPVISMGDRFFNMDNWQVLWFTNNLVAWAKKNPRSIPTDSDIRGMMNFSREIQQLYAPQIFIAKTPEKLTQRTALALVGGAYHEAWHTVYSDRSTLSFKDAKELVKDWGKIKDWTNFIDLFAEVRGWIEDIRIENQGCQDYPGAYIPMCDLADFVIHQEMKLRTEALASGEISKDAKEIKKGVFLCLLRDLGLGYSTDDTRAAMATYKKLAPDVVALFKRGTKIRDIVERARKLGKDKHGFVHLSIELCLVLQEIQEQGPPPPPMPSGDGEGQDSPPQDNESESEDDSDSGASGKKKQKSKSDKKPKQEKSDQKENSDSSDGDSGEGDSGEDENEEESESSDSKGSESKPQKDQKSDKGNKDSKDPSDDGEYGDSEGSDDGDNDGDGDEDEGESEDGEGDSDDDSNNGGEDSGDSDEGDDEDGEDSDGDDGDSSGEDEGEGDDEGDSEGDGDEDGDSEGDGEDSDGDDGDFSGDGGDSNSSQGSQGSQNSSTAQTGGGAGKGESENIQDTVNKILTAEEEKQVQPLTMAEALQIAFELALKQEELPTEKNEKPWNPLTCQQDEVIVIKKNPKLDTEAKQMQDKVKQQVAALRARLRNLVLAREMTDREHGVRRGKSLSARMLVDSKASLMSGAYPNRAYQHTADQQDTSIAMSICIDQSGSMGVLKETVQEGVMVLTEPVESIGGKTFVFGFRDGKSVYGYGYGNDKKYHRTSTMNFDVFKKWDERMAECRTKILQTKATGGTPLSDGIQYGLMSLQNRKEGHRVLVVMTDGMPDDSHIPVMRHQFRVAREAGVHIIGVGITSGASYVQNTFDDYVYAPEISALPHLLILKLTALLERSEKNRGKQVKNVKRVSSWK